MAELQRSLSSSRDGHANVTEELLRTVGGSQSNGCQTSTHHGTHCVKACLKTCHMCNQLEYLRSRLIYSCQRHMGPAIVTRYELLLDIRLLLDTDTQTDRRTMDPGQNSHVRHRMEDETIWKSVCGISNSRFKARQNQARSWKKDVVRMGAARDDSDPEGDGIILTRKSKLKDRVR